MLWRKCVRETKALGFAGAKLKLQNIMLTSTNQKISGCGFHHIAIRTTNWDKSIRFYCDGLGFVEKISWGQAPTRAVMLDTGDGNYLEIFEREEASTLSGEPNLLHLCLRTDDCKAAVETARAAGAEVKTEPLVPDVFTKMGLETMIAFVSGPDGEIIEFFQSREL